MPADYHHQPAPPKADTTKLVSLLLKAIIMTFITTLFFLLIGLACLLFLPLILTSLHRHRRRRCPRPRPRSDLSPRDLKRLPQFRFSAAERQPEHECVVCLEGFRQGQWCRRLVGCGHLFHTKCVDRWLLKVAACPTCRTPLLLAR